MEKTGKSIQEAVAEKIATMSSNVAETVATKLAEVEITKRTDTVTKAILKLEPLEKELAKLGKDDTTHYVEGKPVTSMSKKAYDEFKKAEEKLANLQKTIEKALNENTNDAYKKLEEILNKLSNAGGNQKESSSEA